MVERVKIIYETFYDKDPKYEKKGSKYLETLIYNKCKQIIKRKKVNFPESSEQ
jgi:hypothetical protein